MLSPMGQIELLAQGLNWEEGLEVDKLMRYWECWKRAQKD